MARRSARLCSGTLALAFVIGLPFWISRPTPVSASTESSMASTILGQLNQDRIGLGLVGLRIDSRLSGVATNRAQWMASTGTMSHDSWGGAVYDAIPLAGVNAYSSAEAIGETNATWGTDAANYLYGMWRASPEHWDLMTSRTYNYVGIGVAYRAATGETFASLVFAEEPDISRPVARMTGSGRSGSTVFFTWTGRDGTLQSHTAGLRDFDVEYRVDGGAWRPLMSHTTTRQVILKNRAAGHTYSVRVRDRDRRNNLSPWSTYRTVRV